MIQRTSFTLALAKPLHCMAKPGEEATVVHMVLCIERSLPLYNGAGNHCAHCTVKGVFYPVKKLYSCDFQDLFGVSVIYRC